MKSPSPLKRKIQTWLTFKHNRECVNSDVNMKYDRVHYVNLTFQETLLIFYYEINYQLAGDLLNIVVT